MNTFAQGINQALHDSMLEDSTVICMGLGVTDPKGVFGTTLNLENKFGKQRVMDIPTSENAVTGICIGLSIAGYKPILTHQRVDFALLSLDQIINNAAKLRYMFGGKISCPIVIRMIVGRGWGQGPTHSQNLQMLFTGIPGLRVALPATPQDAYSMLRASIECPDPVIFLEHRWLHNSQTNQELKKEKDALSSQQILKDGNDITIVATSYMVPEAVRALNIIENDLKIKGTLINFRNYHTDKIKEIIESVRKTKKLLFIDTAQGNFSIGQSIIYKVQEELGSTTSVSLISTANVPEPTSHYLTKEIYLGAKDILIQIGKILNISVTASIKQIDNSSPHDVPGEWFKGPF